MPSRWSQQYTALLRLLPWNSSLCRNGGQNVHSKDRRGAEEPPITQVQLAVNRWRWPLQDLLPPLSRHSPLCRMQGGVSWQLLWSWTQCWCLRKDSEGEVGSSSFQQEWFSNSVYRSLLILLVWRTTALEEPDPRNMSGYPQIIGSGRGTSGYYFNYISL